MNKYETYLLQQVGSGIGPYYRNSLQVQRGRGLGSIFSSIYQALKPWIVSGSKALGHEVLRSGKEVIQGLSNDSSKPIDVLLKEQGVKSFRNLSEKAARAMSGQGVYKRKRKAENDLNLIRAKQLKIAFRETPVSKTKKKKSNKKKVVKKKSVKGKKTKKKKKKPTKSKGCRSRKSGGTKKTTAAKKKSKKKSKTSSIKKKAIEAQKDNLISELF